MKRYCDERRDSMRDLARIARQASKNGDTVTLKGSAREWFRLATLTEARKAPQYVEAARPI